METVPGVIFFASFYRLASCFLCSLFSLLSVSVLFVSGMTTVSTCYLVDLWDSQAQHPLLARQAVSMERGGRGFYVSLTAPTSVVGVLINCSNTVSLQASLHLLIVSLSSREFLPTTLSYQPVQNHHFLSVLILTGKCNNLNPFSFSPGNFPALILTCKL